MSDKSPSERIGILETKVDDIEIWRDKQDNVNEEKKNWLIKQMFSLLKLIVGVTILTFLAEMAKEGCRICKIVMNYFTGSAQ